jgi:phosphoglycerol transferase
MSTKPDDMDAVRLRTQKNNLSRSVAAYGTAVVLSILLFVRVMRLWESDLAVPLSYAGDGLLNCMLIKSIAQNGWYLHNPYVGMPTGLEYYDFPFGDTLHFFLLKILSLFSPDFGTTLNLYYYSSFPLTAIAALFVFRRFGFSYACSIVGSLLYTFLPYHFLRGEVHIFLATYYLIPLVVMILLWIGSADQTLPHWRPVADSGDRNRPRIRLLASIVICILLALTGFYYALFACFLLLVVGVYASIYRRSLSPLAISGLLVGIILIGTVANAIPNLRYWQKHGKNPEVAQRNPVDADQYGLRVAQLVLPITNHRIPLLARVKEKYNRFMPFVNENDMAALGTVGTIGFFVLLGCLVVRNSVNVPESLRNLALLNLATVLLATMGGFSSIFAIVVSPQIRAYNRISVFIAFFSFFAVVLCLDRWYRRYAVSPRSRVLFCTFLGFLLVAGVLDQTTRSHRPDYIALRRQHHQDAHFVRQIEVSLGPKAMVFQLPYVAFPESWPVHTMTDYNHFRGYVHSKALRWSYGAMKGREGDRWQRYVAAKPLPEMVKALSAAGFSGIYVNRDGYPDAAVKLEAQLSRLLCTKPILSGDQRLLFFSMTAYNRKRLAQR